MASSFTFFRRHSKVLLAILTAVTVITFTVGGVVLQFFQARAPEDEVDVEAVVATWNDGSVTEGQTRQARYARQTVQALLSQIDRMRTERDSQSAPKAPRLLGGSSDRQIVLDEILAERAEEAGIRFVDEDVNNYLELYGDGLVAPGEIAQAFQKISGGGMQTAAFFERMKKELAILQMYLELSSAEPTLSPATMWDAYLRMMRSVNAKVVAFPVEDFVKEVPEPSEKELRAFYEKYKTDFPNPMQPDPGFRRRYESEFGYFQANFTDFMERAKKSVTDEQIKKEYEEGLARGEFRELELPSGDAIPGGIPSGNFVPPTGGDTTPPATLPPAEAAPGATPPGTAEPAAPETPEGTTPETTPPADPAPSATPEAKTPANESPATPAEETPSTETLETPATPDQNVSLFNLSDERLFVTLQDEGAPETDAAAPGAPNGDENAVDAAPPSGARIVGTPDLAAQVPGPPAGAETTPATEPSTTPPAATTPAAPKFKALEQVSEEIRSRLARPIAQQAMLDAVEAAYLRIDDFYRDRQAAVVKEETPPAMPSFTRVAAEHGLVYRTTPMISELAYDSDREKEYYPLIEAQETEYAAGFGQATGRRSFYETGFRPGTPIFKPTAIYTPDRSSPRAAYVFWKRDERQAAIPEFEEVRDEVLAAWKLEKARELARAAVEEAATKARAKRAELVKAAPPKAADPPAAEDAATDEPEPETPEADEPTISALADLYPKTVKEGGQFSWFDPMSRFNPGAPPMIGAIDNVERPGAELMQAIFALREGEIGYGPNANGTVYYLVEVTDDLAPPAESIDRFLNMPQNFLFQVIQPALAGEMQNFRIEVQKELADDVGLVWKRAPGEEVAEF